MVILGCLVVLDVFLGLIDCYLLDTLPCLLSAGGLFACWFGFCAIGLFWCDYLCFSVIVLYCVDLLTLVDSWSLCFWLFIVADITCILWVFWG